MYKLLLDGCIEYNKSTIPKDIANTDYANYLEWVAKGNVAEIEIEKEKDYKELRQAEYPSLIEIAEALMENADGDPTKLDELKLRRAAVKLKYPKK